MKKILLAGAALAALSTSAFAGSLDYDSYSWSGVGVHVTSPNDISGGAGPITLYKGGNSLGTFWCMDVDNYLTGSGHDSVLPFDLADADSGLPGVPTTLNQTQLNAIGWLVQNGDNAIGDTLKGAYQVAIWKEEYGAAFTYDSLGSVFDNDVINLLTGANVSKASANFALNFYVPLDPSVSQTLVSGGLAAGTPEVSTWAMGLIGFGVVALFGAFGKRKDARALEV